MVASKKSPTKSSTKRTTVKRTTKRTPKKVQARPVTWRFYVVTIGIFVVAVSSVLVLGLFISSMVESQATAAKEVRYGRIMGAYKSLGLDDSYAVTHMNVFGDKRVYDYDKNRTYSSVMEYIHGDTVANTATALDTKIKAAGFHFIGEPYPGAKDVQYHYKSEGGVFLRLTVSSKPRDDAIRNDAAMKRVSPPSVLDMDANAGPSNVIIKVNLDDNNE